MSDYRLSRGCSNFGNICNEKVNLKKEIINTSGFRIDYNAVKDSRYNSKFRSIYNKKCAYCGINTKLIGADTFEVDHFVSIKQAEKRPMDFGDDFDVNSIDNLVSACRTCNNSKSNFPINPLYGKLLNPDLGFVKKVFYRDENYNILISTNYSKNPYIVEYYKKLKLYSQKRRLDYAILELKYIAEKRNDNELEAIINKLLEIRNNVKYEIVLENSSSEVAV